MDTKEKNRQRRKYILKGLRNVLICDIIAVVALSLIAVLYSVIKHAYIMKSIYMAFYYGGAAALIVAIPQLFKRREDPKLKKIRKLDPLHGFYTWFGNSYPEEALMDTFQEFTGDSFWLGIMIVIFSCILFALAVGLESVFFK